MENKDQLSREEISELGDPYFDLQAEMGFTKHLGGLKATRELIELCHTNKDKYVLDVGCGVGITACNIAKRYSCEVIGVDISEEMIEKVGQGGGFVIAPTHFVPAEVPWENVQAFFDAVEEFGQYQ